MLFNRESCSLHRFKPSGLFQYTRRLRQQKVANLVHVSSGLVYGADKEYPFNEDHPVNPPVSLYAATKKSNELMAHSYSDLYDMSVTGLSFILCMAHLVALIWPRSYLRMKYCAAKRVKCLTIVRSFVTLLI